MKRTQMDTEDEFEEEAEENLSVETEDEIRAGPVDFMSRWLPRKEVLSHWSTVSEIEYRYNLLSFDRRLEG